MQITDLRIGNLLLSYEMVVSVESILSSSYRVYCHSEDKEYLGDYEFSKLSPIVLTTEWLMKLGAKKEVLDAGAGIGFYDSYSIGDYELSRVFTNMWGIIGVECKTIKYVHEMQNIIFALTGTELQITKEAIL